MIVNGSTQSTQKDDLFDFQGFNLGQTKPSETDVCFGAEPVCPAKASMSSGRQRIKVDLWLNSVSNN